MNIAQAIKKCALDAFDSTIPCDVIFGEVISTEPVKVKWGDIVLGEDILSLCDSLLYKDATFSFSIYERSIVINEGIKEGDMLVILRKAGGEAYVAIGKL